MNEGEAAAETKRRITEFIERDAEEMETHFVENPFIKMREKASRKQIDSKMHMGAEDLQEDAEAAIQQDVYYLKDEKRFVVQDFEQNEIDRKRERELKRKRQDQFGFEDDEDVSDDDSDRKQASAKRQKAKDIDSANAMKPADVAKFEGQSATAVI